MNDAPMKLKVASIPSKHENVIYRHHKPAAFGNSRKRFYSTIDGILNDESAPGPGMYSQYNTDGYKIYSKKGYGNLVSSAKLERLERKFTGLPGPGAYNAGNGVGSRMKRTVSLALLSSRFQGH